MDNMQRVGDFGTISLTWDVFINSFPIRAQAIMWKRRQNEYKKQKGLKTPRKHALLNKED